MAARRLLIVMLVLLGISTLAAALVPQDTLREDTTTGSTTQRATTTDSEPPPVYFPPTKIKVGGKTLPVVSPVHVGDQITLLVSCPFATELSIPEFGQYGFAAPDAPARFELLAETPGNFGVLLEPSGKVAARIRVVAPKEEGRREEEP